MILNRLNITGEIDSRTPRVVLDEIAESLSIKEHNINRLVLKIYKLYDRNKINQDYKNDIESLRIMARYINSHHTNWRRSVLLEAFDFLNSFEDKEGIVSFSKRDLRFNFSFGNQTSENPRKLNACVLYRLCKYYMLDVNFSTPIQEMARNVKLYFYSIYPNIENSIKNNIFNFLKYDATISDLINFSNLIDEYGIDLKKENKNISYIEYTYEDYERCAEEILRRDDENAIPQNPLESIVMAAIYHKIDLTECEDSLTEYKMLTNKPYFPHDKKIKEKLRIRHIYPENLQNPYINEVFNINLPPNIYSHRDLISLCGQEGINTYEDYYSALQTAYLTETFVHGKQGEIVNRETTFLDKIKDLKYDEVVVFGIRDEKNEMKGYTYSELCDTFSNYRRFIDPITNNLFSEEAVEKLYLLTQKDKRKTETEEIYKERLELGEEIERIKIYISNKNKTVQRFLETYEGLCDEDKKNVEKVINNILHLSMYMRNWDGVGDYPLKSEDTTFLNEKQIVVDHRVTQSLIDLEENIARLGRLGKMVSNLPLMQYHRESNTFITSNDENEGLTIKDRLKIVKGGENENMSSCIRMSSNKFCATAYFYMILMGFRMPFSISEMSHIT